MINAIGVAVFLTNDFEDGENFSINRNNALIETMSSEKKRDYYGNPILEVTCKYSIFLNEDPECKTINDYAGKVSPFLRSIIELRLVRTQTYKLCQIEKPVKHIKDIIAQYF